SKFDVYKLLPKSLYPKTCLFSNGTDTDTIKQTIKQQGYCYPIIAKPDIGERGLGVKKINNDAELEKYATNIPVNFLVQEFVDYQYEVGIFYYRMPEENKGHISGIVFKEPVTVTGDGIHTVEELVKANDRYYLQLNQIKKAHTEKLQLVLKKGVPLELIP